MLIFSVLDNLRGIIDIETLFTLFLLFLAVYFLTYSCVSGSDV